MRDLEIGWIAGFLDGDGCFGWYGENNRRKNSRKTWIGYPSVTASQLDPEPLERISKRFPGTIRLIGIQKNGKESWEYRVNNKIAIEIMMEVYPLISKRRQETIMCVVANYASREAERLNNSLRCSKDHLREFHGFRTKAGERRCKQCNKEWKINSEKKKLKTGVKV